MRVPGGTAALRRDHVGMGADSSAWGLICARTGAVQALSRSTGRASSSRRCRGGGRAETERPPHDFPLTAGHVWHTDLASLRLISGEVVSKRLVPEGFVLASGRDVG
jgi:hypothetical protein